MKKTIIKTISLIMSIIIILTSVSPTIASGNYNEEDNIIIEQEEEILEAMQFYFSDVGKISKDGVYTITNLKLLKEAAEAIGKKALIGFSGAVAIADLAIMAYTCRGNY